MKLIDKFLNKITMYRLVLYYLIFLLGVAVILSFFKVLAFNPIAIILSTCLLVVICWMTNKLFAKVFNAPTNVESVYISALILALILTPIASIQDVPLFIWAAVLAMASKFILSLFKKHIFNPVAIAVALTAFGFSGSASWWVGTLPMLPFVLLGFLIVRKIRRFDMIFYFFIAAVLTTFCFSIAKGSNLFSVYRDLITSSSLFFFAFIMLTEPLTTPPTIPLQIIYGAFVGILFVPQFQIGSFTTTPETALLIGNVFSYLVSPKFKIMTTIQGQVQAAAGALDFLFIPEKKVVFIPGQYMEWTLPHSHADSRGNRRYFTIASSPTEETMRLGIKYYSQVSTYKQALQSADQSVPFVGAQLAGDFVLPKNKNQKLVFIAGGIGITPFRSMIKYLTDINEPRQITLFYTNKTQEEIAYRDVFNEAEHAIGLRAIYTLTDKSKIPSSWNGAAGRIDEKMIRKYVPDFLERTFYISGPNAMVESIDNQLRSMGINEKHIKKDFFPGLAS